MVTKQIRNDGTSGCKEAVRALLRGLGLTENYNGFMQTACAVQLALEAPERLQLVTKCIYPDVAKQCATTNAAVERNIRTAAACVWRKKANALMCLAGMRLAARPSNACFLAILTGYLRGERIFPR